MRWIKSLLIGLGAVIGLLVVIGLLLPREVHVERSIVIAAPPATVFPMLNDLRNFNRWSPWARIDPETRYSFSGPSSGTGAAMAWDSDHPNVDKGRMEIIESSPGQQVVMLLDFGPKGSAEASLGVQADGQGSRVTWRFDEDFGYNLMGRYFGLMLDALIGGEYEKGLNNLKALLEQGEASG